MASRLLRRSGIAVCISADLIGWVPDVVIQVGVGLRSQETDVIKDAWPKVRLIGFEPHPAIFNTMRPLYPGEMHQLAISNADGEAVFYTKKLHKDGSSLFPHNERRQGNEYGQMTVQTRRLDSFFALPPEGNLLLWLDCEGGELDALLGGEHLLQSVGMINVELTSKPLCRGWCSHLDVHRLLKKQGFKRLWVHTQRMGSGQIDAVYVRPNLFRPEYCCCPCELEEGC